MNRVVEFPVVICLMVMSSGVTAMTLGRLVPGMVMLVVGLVVGAVLVGWFDERRWLSGRNEQENP